MTLTQAAIILKTYKMPLTAKQYAEYKKAIQVLAGSAFGSK